MCDYLWTGHAASDVTGCYFVDIWLIRNDRDVVFKLHDGSTSVDLDIVTHQCIPQYNT